MNFLMSCALYSYNTLTVNAVDEHKAHRLAKNDLLLSNQYDIIFKVARLYGWKRFRIKILCLCLVLSNTFTVNAGYEHKAQSV